jgi:hypothetical protein
MAASKYNLSGYTQIRIKTNIDAEIVRSDSFSIDVETGPLSPVSIRKKGDALSIGRPLRWFVSGFFFRLSRSRVKIGMPELRELTVSNNSSAVVAGFDSIEDFKLTLSDASSFNGNLKTGDARLQLSGASRAEVNGSSGNLFLKLRDESNIAGNINVNGNVEIDVSGNSEIRLTGSTGSIMANINHASTADLSGFPAHDVRIRMYRLSRAIIQLDGKLDAVLTGASDLKWTGTPGMGDINVSNGSILRQEQSRSYSFSTVTAE